MNERLEKKIEELRITLLRDVSKKDYPFVYQSKGKELTDPYQREINSILSQMLTYINKLNDLNKRLPK